MYSKNELEKWYELVKNSHKKRLVVLHNNLDLSHFLRNSKSYLISWDKSKIDIPIFDLYKLLCLIPLSALSNEKIFLSDIDVILKSNGFLTIDIECVTKIISSLINKKIVGTITTEDYLNIMDNLSKVFKYKNNEAQNAYVFTDEELEEPEDKNYS